MRLFLGLPVPPSPVFADVARRIKERHPDLRPVPEGSWHVTLRFLGEVRDPGPVVAAVGEALAGQAAMPCRVRGLGAFPRPGDARVVWAGVEAGGDLAGLVQRIEEATALYGKPPDPRPFHAHVTLGRFRLGADLSHDLYDQEGLAFSEGVLDRVVLWESTLGPGGPVYDSVAEFALEGASSRAHP